MKIIFKIVSLLGDKYVLFICSIRHSDVSNAAFAIIIPSENVNLSSVFVTQIRGKLYVVSLYTQSNFCIFPFINFIKTLLATIPNSKNVFNSIDP